MIEFPITLTSGGSVCLPGYASALALGYAKNKSVSRLAVTATGEWAGLTIRAFWHVPGGSDPASTLVVETVVMSRRPLVSYVGRPETSITAPLSVAPSTSMVWPGRHAT